MQLIGVAGCFLLSGFAALLYQTAWLRQLSIVFGTSEVAVATVLAAYMGGLTLGAALAGRYLSVIRRPVFVYGLMEAGIALSALAVPLLLGAASTLYVAALGAQPIPPDAASSAQSAFYLIVTFAVLVTPTALMGATLPLLARYAVRTDLHVGPRIAALYGINTAGAVLGTVTAAFVLLPTMGLLRTVMCGVGINVIVFLLAVALSRAQESETNQALPMQRRLEPGFYVRCIRPLLGGSETLADRLNGVFRCQPVWALPLMLASGAVALHYEVLWTRMLTHVMGGSIYAFATMLAAFLTGIAIGSTVIGRFAHDRDRAALMFAVSQIAIAVSSALVYRWLDTLLPASRGTFEHATLALTVLLPSTLFMGATFPLAVRMIARDETVAGVVTARVYVWNTIGAIIGSLLAGYFLIPALGFAGAVKLAVAVNLLLALIALICIARPRLVPVGVTTIGLLGVVVFYSPTRPDAIITSTGFDVPRENEEGEELYFAVGRSASVLLEEAGGRFDLRTNGLPEASILPLGALPIGQTQHWLTGLPLVARPNASRVLVIGLGGGVSLEGIADSVETIDVVELEPEVLNANRRLAGRRAVDPLEDERIHIVLNDARNALRLTSAVYDVIVSQPSHPWTAGASHLFTSEFFSLAHAHLSADGVFLQWMSAGFVDSDLLRSLASSLASVFDNVRLYQPRAGTLLFLATDGPLDLERQLAETNLPLRNNLLHYSYMGLNGAEDLVAALLLDETGLRAFSEGAPLATDDRNRMATDSRSLSDGLDTNALLELVAPLDPLLDAEGWVHTELRERLDFGYIAGRLLAERQAARAGRLANVIADRSTQLYVTGLVHGYLGRLDTAREAFAAALAADPGNSSARYAIVEPELPALASNRASEELTQLARGLPVSAQAVVRGWQLAARRNWDALAALDRSLARAEVTDLWYPESVQLRADWRTQAVGEARHAFDAMRLIDRALSIRPKLELYLLRAASADRLDDDAAFVETSRSLLDFVRSRLEVARDDGNAVTGAELEMIAERLVALRGRLDSMSGAMSGRARTVADAMTTELDNIRRIERARLGGVE